MKSDLFVAECTNCHDPYWSTNTQRKFCDRCKSARIKESRTGARIAKEGRASLAKSNSSFTNN